MKRPTDPNSPPPKKNAASLLSYLPSGRRAILDSLERAIERGRFLQMIIGDEGTGKSYMIQQLRERLARKWEVVHLPYPRISLAEILREGLHQLGVTTRFSLQSDGVALFRAALHRFRQAGKSVILVVDDAQFMGMAGVCELIDLWNEVSGDGEDEAFSILLAGTDALQAKMHQAKMRLAVKEKSFRKRPLEATPLEKPLPTPIQLSLDDFTTRLLPFTELDTEAYVRGFYGKSAVFLDSAVAQIHLLSGGRPNLIDQICTEAIARASSPVGLVSTRLVSEIGRDRFLLVSPVREEAPRVPLPATDGGQISRPDSPSRGVTAIKRGLDYIRSFTTTSP